MAAFFFISSGDIGHKHCLIVVVYLYCKWPRLDDNPESAGMDIPGRTVFVKKNFCFLKVFCNNRRSWRGADKITVKRVFHPDDAGTQKAKAHFGAV